MAKEILVGVLVGLITALILALVDHFAGESQNHDQMDVLPYLQHAVITGVEAERFTDAPAKPGVGFAT